MTGLLFRCGSGFAVILSEGTRGPWDEHDKGGHET